MYTIYVSVTPQLELIQPLLSEGKRGEGRGGEGKGRGGEGTLTLRTLDLEGETTLKGLPRDTECGSYTRNENTIMYAWSSGGFYYHSNLHSTCIV